MLNDASGFKHIYFCSGYTDPRRGIDGLIAVVNAEFKLDPTESNSIFLFCGRRCDRIKTLLYEGDGWLLCYKRFTDGKLQWPRSTNEARTLTPQQYRCLMEGLSIDQKKPILPVKPESIPGTSSIPSEEPLPVLFYTVLRKVQRQTS